MSANHSPRRIVSLQPSATVILAALGQLERLVGCTKYCAQVCPQAAQGRKFIADSWAAKTDEILSARPDLVIAAVPYQEKSVSEILKSGVRFLGLAPKTLADIYADIATIAGVTGTAERGEQIVGDMQQEIEALYAQTRQLNQPRVFCEEWGKPLIASQPWVAELIEAAGGEFIGEPGAQRTAQAVLREDPEIVIAAWCGAGERVPLEKIVRERGWGEMRAVRDGRVYCIRDEFLNTPAPTLLNGLRALAAALHPDRFPRSLGLRAIASEATGSVSEHRRRL